MTSLYFTHPTHLIGILWLRSQHIDNVMKKIYIPHDHSDINWWTWCVCCSVWYWRGHALKCIVLGINHQSRMLILPWPCAECGGNGVCGAKDNTAAFVLEENNTADDAALCCCCRCRPRSHVALCQVTRPDKVAYCKDTDGVMYWSVFILHMHHCGALWFRNHRASSEFTRKTLKQKSSPLRSDQHPFS